MGSLPSTKKKEKIMAHAKAETQENKPRLSVGELVARIESMPPKEKQAFCKTLSEEEKRSYIKYLKDRDMELVDVVFRCFEPLGGMVKFAAKPYEGVPEVYELYDNVTYKLPLCLAKRFNSEFQGIGTFYPTHAYVMDAQGRPMVGVGKKNYRFGTTSPSLG